MSGLPAFKSLELRVSETGESFKLVLLPNTEPAALMQAVYARAVCSAFFLTMEASRDSTIVPLTTALPDGMCLTLHYADDRDLASLDQQLDSEESEARRIFSDKDHGNDLLSVVAQPLGDRPDGQGGLLLPSRSNR